MSWYHDTKGQWHNYFLNRGKYKDIYIYFFFIEKTLIDLHKILSKNHISNKIYFAWVTGKPNKIGSPQCLLTLKSMGDFPDA